MTCPYTLTGIVAHDDARGIGFCGRLPWHIPADMRRFRQLTWGHPILMGRKTFESIGHPLPGRQNIVLTHRTNFSPAPGVSVIRCTEELAETVSPGAEVMVIGGAAVYAQLLGQLERLYVSLVPGVYKADVYFPAYEHIFSGHTTPEPMDGYTAVMYERRSRNNCCLSSVYETQPIAKHRNENV